MRIQIRKIKFTPGGVGRNIAQNPALLGNKARY